VAVKTKAIVFSQFWIHLKLLKRELSSRQVRGCCLACMCRPVL